MFLSSFEEVELNETFFQIFASAFARIKNGNEKKVQTY